MNLQKLGLQELSTNEQVETNGGSILIGAAIVAGAIVLGLGTGLLTAYYICD